MLPVQKSSVTPIVSVIIPCFNAGLYLSTAISSVIKQSHNQIEIIVVNDGSTDDTEDIVSSFRDSRIKYFYQENKGQCAASNFGLQQANGDYIKFFDADDVMNPRHLEAQLTRLQNSENSIASCAWGRFYDGNPASAEFKPETVWKDMQPLDWIKSALKQKYDMMGVWLWLIPRQLIEKVGGWDPRLSLNNDFEFSVRLLLNVDRVLFSGDAKLYYRSGSSETLSQRPSEQRFADAILSTDLGCSYLLKVENTAEMRHLCANRYQRWLYAVYPDYPNLESTLLNRIEELGGSDRLPEGGAILNSLSTMLGWRMAKRIKLFLQKKGYKKLPFN